AGQVRVASSGWRYPAWRGDFYPQGLAQRRELEYAGEHLTSIEINGSFYSPQRPPSAATRRTNGCFSPVQRPRSYAAWRADVPEGFVFAVKGPRYVSHLKRLKDVEVPLA